MEKEITASGEKIAIIGDLHLSPKCENASIRSAVVGGQEAFIDKLVADLHEQGIKKAVFCGDLFTTRTFISVTGLEYAIDMFRNKLKDIECYVIAGNHDLAYENSAESTSIRFLELLPNVHVFVDTIGKAKLAGKQFFFVPWIVTPEKEIEVRKWLESWLRSPRRPVRTRSLSDISTFSVHSWKRGRCPRAASSRTSSPTR